jgi:hypothetical protein
MTVQRPNSVGMLPAQQQGLFRCWYTRLPNGQDEHKICVPVNSLYSRRRKLTALQRPSSVGIRPVIFLSGRFVTRWFLAILANQPINLSEKVLTGQMVVTQLESHQCREEAEFRRDVACAARSFNYS